MNIVKIIRSEHLKLWRSPLWLPFLVLPSISAFFGTFNYLNNLDILTSEWYSLWSQHSLFLCYFFMPALIGACCSYLWRLEHTNHNWNSFLTAPVPILALYLGKLIHAVMMLVLGNCWIFLLFYLCGRLSGIESPLLRHSHRHRACRRHRRAPDNQQGIRAVLSLLPLQHGHARQQPAAGD